MSTITRRFPIEGPVTLDVDVVACDVTVTAGHETDVVVELTCSDDTVDLSTATIEARDGRVRVQVPGLQPAHGPSGLTFQWGRHSIQIGGGSPSLELDVRLPGGCDATVVTKTGDVELTGPLGRVSVEGAASDVEARDVEVLRVRTSSGDIEARDLGEAELQTGSGDVDVRDVQGPVTAQTASGDILVMSPGADVHAGAASGDVEVRGVRTGTVTAQTASGDVTVSVVRGVPVWFETQTVSGDVSNLLSRRGEPADGEPYVSVSAASASGDVTLLDD